MSGAVDPMRMKAAVAMDAMRKYAEDSNVAFFMGKDAPPIERIPTGSFLLDWALCGGLARGRVYQYGGQPSSGKTSMALNVCARVAEAGGNALWMAAEDFDWTYARSIGIPTDDSFVMMQTPDGDVLLDMVVSAVREGMWDVVVVDSVTAVRNMRYGVERDGTYEKSVGERDRGGQGAMLSEFFRRISSAMTGLTVATMRRTRILSEIASEASRKKPSERRLEALRADVTGEARHPVIIVINQVRQSGVGGGYQGLDSPGGWALKHHKAGDVLFMSKQLIWPGGKVEAAEDETAAGRIRPNVGLLAREMFVNVVKHKVGVPYRSGLIRLGQTTADGYVMGRPSREFEVAALGRRYGGVEQSGSWFSVGETRAQGEGAFCAKLAAHPDLRIAMEARIMELSA